MGKKISIDDAIKIAEKKGGLRGLEDISFKIKKTSVKTDIEENRTVVIQSKLKPSEKKEFLDLIGRETESNAVRNLILEFIKNNT